jgi:ubiquinone/menaquinone biosynthesis C-methylase UbiE
MELSRISNGRVIGIDIHQPFMDVLMERSAKMGFSNIDVLNCSINKLPSAKESINIIWG